MQGFQVFGISYAVGKLSHYCEALSPLSQDTMSGFAVICVNTFLNSWYTSDHMGERFVISCISGREEYKEKLALYMSCYPPCLIACSALKLIVSFASSDFLERLGFPMPSSTYLIISFVVLKHITR